MSTIDSRLELSTAQDPYLDYCLWDYAPLAPWENKLRSVNLLFHSFSVAGANDRMFDLCEAIRRGIGPFRTVWSVKNVAGLLSWEFYFYDYGRLERERSIPRLLEIIHPYVPCQLTFEEKRPYFMFSIDLDNALLNEERSLDEINVYIGNVGSNVSSGICFLVTDKGPVLQNLYFFFDAEKEMEDIVGKIACSIHLDLPGFDLEAVLWPEFRNCKTIVVANKKNNDGIYFSRIDINQLLVFFNRMGYPEDLVAFVDSNRDRLDHLQFDVGFDYVMHDGGIKFLKSGYYGVF